MGKAEINEAIQKLSHNHRNRLKEFRAIPAEYRPCVLNRLPLGVRKELLKVLPNKDLLPVIEHLDPDEVTDVIQQLPLARQKKVIAKLHKSLQESVLTLSEFDPKSAAGLMNLDYIQIEGTDTIASAAKQFREHEKRTGRLPIIIAVEGVSILGYLPIHQLGFANSREQVKKYLKPLITIQHNASESEVVEVFKQHPHDRVAVLGKHGNIVGIIYSDDVLQVLFRTSTASALYDFAGVDQEESVTDSTMTKVHYRYKWLIINLGTAFLAAFTVGLFNETIDKHVLLAMYMPIVAGMGGNAATQTLAILVRGIALNQISLATALPTIRREIAAGLINGVINGILIAAVVLTFNNDPKLALVLASAMIINLLVAGFFGTLVPLLMKAFGKDPATSASIFITTATDVLGFLAFLGLATVVLG